MAKQYIPSVITVKIN